MADVEFYWDPICPFAWVTSRWVAKVAAQRDYEVDWRFISLRFLNESRDYERDFPAGYLDLHTRGLRMLRVAAAVRHERGPAPIGSLYQAFGESIWDRPPPGGEPFASIGEPAHLEAVLHSQGLPAEFAGRADSDEFDQLLRDETATALTRAGRDVGTPIVVFEPPDGVAFFGPVISRIPTDAESLVLWDAVMTLGAWPGFAERYEIPV